MSRRSTGKKVARSVLRAAGVRVPRSPLRGTTRIFKGKNRFERILIFLVLAVVVGVTVGLILPKFSPEIGQLAGE